MYRGIRVKQVFIQINYSVFDGSVFNVAFGAHELNMVNYLNSVIIKYNVVKSVLVSSLACVFSRILNTVNA